MAYSEDILKKMVNMGILGYTPDKIANILDIDNNTDVNKFIFDFNNPDSDISRAYRKGVDKSDYSLDMKLYKMASDGDLKALQKYEERKSYQKVIKRK